MWVLGTRERTPLVWQLPLSPEPPKSCVALLCGFGFQMEKQQELLPWGLHAFGVISAGQTSFSVGYPSHIAILLLI